MPTKDAVAVRSTKPLSEETRVEARRLLAEGCTYRAIGRALSVHHTTIQKISKRDKSAAGQAPRASRQGSAIPMEVREQIIAELECGVQRKHIGAKFGVSAWSVSVIAATMPRDEKRETPPEVWTGARKLVAARLLKQRLMVSYIAEKLTIDFPGPAVMAADVVSFQQSLGSRQMIPHSASNHTTGNAPPVGRSDDATSSLGDRKRKTRLWTQERIENLTQLWAEDATTPDIGKALGIGKHAVIGKAHRLGLPGRPSPIKRVTRMFAECAQ